MLNCFFQRLRAKIRPYTIMNYPIKYEFVFGLILCMDFGTVKIYILIVNTVQKKKKKYEKLAFKNITITIKKISASYTLSS